jgi:hypothetical protein
MKLILQTLAGIVGLATAVVIAPFVYCCILWIIGYALYI